MLRGPPKRVRTRIVTAVCGLILVSCVAQAWDDAASSRAYAKAVGPSKLDYLVLASFVDSPQLLAMAGRTTATGRKGRDAGEEPEAAELEVTPIIEP